MLQNNAQIWTFEQSEKQTTAIVHKSKYRRIVQIRIIFYKFIKCICINIVNSEARGGGTEGKRLLHPLSLGVKKLRILLSL